MGEPLIWCGSTNFVARELGFNGGTWVMADEATNAYFGPLDTFGERFEQLLVEIRDLGFEAVDLWTAHLNGAWATPEHLAIASELIKGNHLPVGMVMGGFFSREDIENACRVAAGIGATSIGGMVRIFEEDPAMVISIAADHDLKVSLENHPESPQEILELIERGDDARVGTTIDTGWSAAYGHDPLEAIDVLHEHLIRIHLKDVPRVNARKSCFWGEGIVPIRECINRAMGHGFQSFMVDHEPFDYDPTDQCRRMLASARTWVKEAA